MKKTILAALAALALTASLAQAGGIGVGAFGGVMVPVPSDNQTQGTVYGVRVPVSLVPMISVEPFYAKGKFGDKDIQVLTTTVSIPGADVTSYGANVALNLGGPVRFYPYAGLNSTKFEFGAASATYSGWQAGLGFGLSLAGIAVDARAEVGVFNDTNISDKTASVTVGASYALFK
jgi:hypothetical protein